LKDLNVQKLDFAVIGVQKSATTWLNDCLKTHPELNVKRVKNEEFYLYGPVFKDKGEQWYWSLFDDKDGKKGCVSVDYFVDNEIPEKLYAHNPTMKIILSLRSPLHRSVSAYYWYLRKSMIPDVSLNEAMQQAVTDFQLQKDTAFRELIDRSLYAAHLQKILNIFPVSQIMVIHFETIDQQPDEVLQKLFNFLAVDASYKTQQATTKPKQNTYNKLLIRFQRLSSSKYMGKIADLLNQYYSKFKGKKKTERPTVSEDIAVKLQNIFEEDQVQLIQLGKKYQIPELISLEKVWKKS